jgi:hypothetical protein
MANFVSSNKMSIKGKRIGNDKTAKREPLFPALPIIAAIIVEDAAMPIFPIMKESKNKGTFLSVKEVNSMA